MNLSFHLENSLSCWTQRSPFITITSLSLGLVHMSFESLFVTNGDTGWFDKISSSRIFLRGEFSLTFKSCSLLGTNLDRTMACLSCCCLWKKLLKKIQTLITLTLQDWHKPGLSLESVEVSYSQQLWVSVRELSSHSGVEIDTFSLFLVSEPPDSSWLHALSWSLWWHTSSCSQPGLLVAWLEEIGQWHLS